MIGADVAEQLLAVPHSADMVSLLHTKGLVDTCRLEYDFVVELMSRRVSGAQDTRDLLWHLFPSIAHLTLDQLGYIVCTAVAMGNSDFFCSKLMAWIDTCGETPQALFASIQKEAADPRFVRKMEGIKAVVFGPRRTLAGNVSVPALASLNVRV